MRPQFAIYPPFVHSKAVKAMKSHYQGPPPTSGQTGFAFADPEIRPRVNLISAAVSPGLRYSAQLLLSCRRLGTGQENLTPISVTKFAITMHSQFSLKICIKFGSKDQQILNLFYRIKGLKKYFSLKDIRVFLD